MRDGHKKIELRLYDEKRQLLQVGDTIEFLREPGQQDKISTEVAGLLRYRAFADLVQDFPASVFGHTNTEDVLANVRKFYSEEDEVRYTVLGIRIRLIS